VSYPKEVLDALERDHGITFGKRSRSLEDRRFCYGATCSWFGPIGETKTTPAGLPGCPHCGGVLFEIANDAAWWEGVDAYEKDKPYPGYRRMWEWQWAAKRCFTLRNGIADLEKAYKESQT
jgi:hypothetical protein